MVDPEVRPVDGQPPSDILPFMKGAIRGENFVVSADRETCSLYVQFEGWIVEYEIQAVLEEAYSEVWGPTPDEYDIDLPEGFGSEESDT